MSASPDIFLSYNREDADVARRFAEGFEAQGFNVWSDQTLHSGEDYDEVTENALHEAKAVVVLWSPRSVVSRWVRAEATVANQNGTLVPVTIEACRRPVMFELKQTADLSHWRGASDDQAWQAFVDDVRRKVGRSASETAAPTASHASASESTQANRKRGLARFGRKTVGILALLLIVSAALVYVFVRSSGQDAPTTAASQQTGPSIAVLPFANLTGDPDKDYLGDGMAEELINTLAKVQGLKVPARTSTFAYKDRNTDIRQIASDLGVESVLEGSVRAAGDRIRITAQLINAKDGLHVWSETYDEEFTDLFKLQDKLASEIATALQPKLQSAVQAVVAQGPPAKDVEAYNLYLQGQSLVERPSMQNAESAIAYFEQALARDKNLARAYGGISTAELILFSVGRSGDHLAAAERAARQALELDANLARAHMSLATVHLLRRQPMKMEEERRRALALAPDDALIRSSSSTSLFGVAHVREALAEAEKAYALAPANPRVVAFLALCHMMLGHDREARKYADAAGDLGYPRNSFPIWVVYSSLAQRAKRYSEASDITVKALDLRDPDQARFAKVVPLVFAALADPGRRDAALTALSRFYASPSEMGGPKPMGRQLCVQGVYNYAQLDAVDEAYDLAGKCRGTAGTVLGFAFVGPEFRPLRVDSHYQSLFDANAMEYFRRYGPPDDCDLKGEKLTCH